jgi:RimJ/RimL family protein N-acetyltransferase
VIVVSAPIGTTRLLLRPFRTADLDELYAIQSRPEVVRYLYWDVRSREEVADVIAQRTHRDRIVEEGDILVLAVERREDGRLIGDVNLTWASAEHQQGEIGFVFHPDAQGHGYATEAAGVILDLAFTALRLHRVYGRTDARNTASAGVMKRLGMRQEAHLRENEMFKGEWGDELVFAILADEWAARA